MRRLLLLPLLLTLAGCPGVTEWEQAEAPVDTLQPEEALESKGPVAIPPSTKVGPNTPVITPPPSSHDPALEALKGKGRFLGRRDAKKPLRRRRSNPLRRRRRNPLRRRGSR